MKIDIWSDFACPFCYAGIKRFEEALKELGQDREVEINYRSLELNPKIGTEGNMSLIDMLASNYGKTKEEALEMVKKSADFVRSEGLLYDYENQIVTKTLDAHRLVYYAKTHGKESAMKDILFKAYFAEAMNIGNPEILMDLAMDIGLDRDKVRDVLNSDAYLDNIEQDYKDAHRLRIELVPTFIFDDKTRVSGVINKESFNEIFN
ncbi:MAG TPA: DsbA family oxidoreductase [Clostridiales bacterium]|nr:DsbA family oxidoreductase [Clostridiales bacterium]